MIYNNVDGIDIGPGIFLFKNAIDLDWEYIYNLCNKIIEQESSDMYKRTTDPETGEEVYINKSGYLFSKKSIESTPKRGSKIHQSDDPQIKSLFNFIEQCKDKYLLKYFERYPLAYNCVWWKVKGHLISYTSGARLGSHSDVSIDYAYGVHQTNQELAVRHVVTCVIYLNSSIDNLEKDNTSYTDGEHYFNYLNVTYKPSKGDIIMFPSNFLAAHEVLPVGSGIRLSYLGWYSQGTPNPLVREDVCDPLVKPELADTSNNIYLPTLREDYREYLLSKGYRTDSEQYRVTNLNLN